MTATIPAWIEQLTDQPDHIGYYPDGSVEKITYYDRGKTCVHRIDGPAAITYHKNGVKKTEQWITAGILRRDTDPATFRWDEAGNLILLGWYKGNKCHRENDLPAFEKYYATGEIQHHIWYRNGIKHRISGPAIIEYNKDGSISSQHFYENGVEVFPEISK